MSTAGQGCGNRGLTRVRPAWRASSLVLALAAGASSVLSPAYAARWNVEPGVAAQTTYTTNSGFQSSARQREEDTIVEIAPRIALRGEGARFRILGSMLVNTITYVDRTQESSVFPEGDLSARLEGIERFFFVEGGVRATRTLENPFGPRTDGSASSVNAVSATQSRLTPYFQGNFAPTVRYQVRSENTFTRQTDAAIARADEYFSRHSAEVTSDPRPFGVSVQAERENTRFSDSVLSTLTQDVGRVILTAALSTEFTVALRGGYERNNFVATDNEGAIYGGGVQWRPSERTDLSLYAERRFFGTGWRATFTHRMPWLSWNFSSSRDVSSFAQALLDLPPSANIQQLLDAIFTTRFPDPAERARVVQDVIVRNGLPSSTTAPATLYGQRVSLVAAQTASVAWVGPRFSIALSAYQSRSEELFDASAFPVLQTALENNVQRGASLTLGHALTPLLGLSATATHSEAEGVGAAAGLKTTQSALRVQATRRLGPKTSGFIGARHQVLQTTGQDDAKENAAFVGLSHIF